MNDSDDGGQKSKIKLTGNQSTRNQTMGSGLTASGSLTSHRAQQYLTQAFKFFDYDNTGYITKLNLKNIMAQYGDIEEVEDEVVEYIIE